jgi:hypothetical protein
MRFLPCIGAALFLLAPMTGATAEGSVPYRAWIEQMKSDPRGPFSAIKWFCQDGSVLPPTPFACKPHGGGYQHGAWSARTQELRAKGYFIATLLAGIDAPAFVDAPEFPDIYAQMLVERYLVAVDDGWILRRASSYRGAIQAEDELAGARALLVELAGRNEWLDTRYALLRIGARLLPHGEDSASVQQIRQVSASLADRDAGFEPLRAKIHGAPDAADAQRVRDYAASNAPAALRQEYESLAAEIDAVYRARPLPEVLRAAPRSLAENAALGPLLSGAADRLQRGSDATSVFETTAALLADLRTHMSDVSSGAARLDLLDLSLRVESEHFRAGAELMNELGNMTRAQRSKLLAAGAAAAYGTGTLRRREYDAMLTPIAALASGASTTVGAYLDALKYLGRAPGWASQDLQFHFLPAMHQLAALEPKAELFVPDQVRGSPMLAYSRIVDTLARDADLLAGVRYRLFDHDDVVGFRALNPGLARGTLVTNPNMTNIGGLRADGIYLLPETVSELPPVAGILTAGEGNPLSHVQLLARNLGIPNVAVSAETVDLVREYDGRATVLAVSPSGVVEIQPDGPEWKPFFEDATQAGDVVIRPDLQKLDLSVRDFIDLDHLRASDSGRIVGPKAAKLGELKHAFPDKVAPGVAIPFGLFRQVVLDRPYKNSDRSVFDWMVGEYRRIEQLPRDAQPAAYEQLRSEIYRLVSETDPGPEFRAALRRQMEMVFGTADEVGVFIRSDTNVEDLPGFTGAGLNLTLPNVVGFDNIITGLEKVWASPYTQRAFAWRNSHMEGPEHVYPAVLLLRTVPSEKSGVMITANVDNGDRTVLSVAVNEGVGGAVDGQAAESLRVARESGTVQLLSTATAPTRRVPQPQGGVAEVPASGTDTVLQPGEIQQLIAFADELPQKFPPIVDAQGQPAPADVEFAFVAGRLQLLQIRPFLESRRAKSSVYLASMDRDLAARRGAPVDLTAVPASSRASIDPAPGARPSATASALPGSRWRLVEIQSMDDAQGTSRPDDPSKYTMAFGIDGMVAMRLNCNRARGPWSDSPNPSGTSGSLSIGPLAVTRAACTPPSLDGRIARDMAFVRSYTQKDGHLYLSLMADGGIYVWEPDTAARDE